MLFGRALVFSEGKPFSWRSGVERLCQCLQRLRRFIGSGFRQWRFSFWSNITPFVTLAQIKKIGLEQKVTSIYSSGFGVSSIFMPLGREETSPSELVNIYALPSGKTRTCTGFSVE